MVINIGSMSPEDRGETEAPGVWNLSEGQMAGRLRQSCSPGSSAGPLEMTLHMISVYLTHSNTAVEQELFERLIR